MSTRTPRHSHNPRPPRAAAVARWLLGAAGCGLLAGCSWGRSVALKTTDGLGQVGAKTWSIVSGTYDERTDSFMARRDEPAEEANRAVEQAGMLHARGNSARAIELLEATVERAPHDADAHLELASILAARGQFGDAEAAADAALAASPNNADALFIKAQIAERRGRPDAALTAYHRVLAATPGHLQARLRVAELELQAQHPERAAPLLRAVCQSSQASPRQKADALWSLGIAYGQQNRWDDAVAALAAAAPARPGMTADDWYHLARARQMAGDAEGAQRDLRHALEIQPLHRAATALQSELGAARL